MPVPKHMVAVVNGPNPVKGEPSTVYARCGFKMVRATGAALPTVFTSASLEVTCGECREPVGGWREVGLPI